MTPHDELDQLSAYIDGELDDDVRTRLETHLQGCDECRTTLVALRSTLVDLGALPEPAPSEQDSWALRSALARTRTQKRWPRFAWAAGTVAAGLIAFVAFTHQGTQQSGSLATGAYDRGGATVPVYSVDQNFDAMSAQTHLLDVAGVVPNAAPVAGSGAKSGRNPKVTTLHSGAEFSAIVPDPTPPETQIDRCAAIVKRSTQENLTPLRYELTTFDSTPAFFLFFSTPDRTELWAVTRDTCDVLYFGQTR
jgi:Putative zinc-finger